MYQSRFHFNHGNVHISMDSLTGEIVEIYNSRTEENLIKNSMYDVKQPFTVQVNAAGKLTEYFPPDSRAVLRDMSKKCVITSRNTLDGLLITAAYSVLSDGKSEVDANVEYNVLLNGDSLTFTLTLHSLPGETVREVRFPVLLGLQIGDYHENTLYYPEASGMKLINPSYALSRPKISTQWCWQEYRYTYDLEGITTSERLRKRKLYGLAGKYPSVSCSMSYMELCGKNESIYFGCHTKNNKPCFLEAGVQGADSPGIVLSAAYEPFVPSGKEYTTPECVICLHEGDWHKGAEIYRNFRLPFIKENAKPEWPHKSAGLFAHYDFKYQSGGIVHRYSDIPRLAVEAADAGLDHILLSGWHKDGFDRGFPLYYCDPQLGSEKEFIDGITAARTKGIHVSLYMNIRIHNSSYYTESIIDKAVMNEARGVDFSSYGNPDISFTDMCPACEQWQNVVRDAAARATEIYGADGIYFDQLGCEPLLCFNDEHGHDIDAFTGGYIDILTEVSKRYNENTGERLLLMGEWPCDALGGVTAFMLNQLFFDFKIGAFPEMFRYTFPEIGVVDILYPGKNLAMRPVHVADASEYLMAKIFTVGCYFWIYDLEEDNTFKRDEKGAKLLSQLIKLRKIWLSEFGEGVFLDTDGICCNSESIEIKRFETEKGTLLAGYRLSEGSAVAEIDFPFSKAVSILPDGTKTAAKVSGHEIRLPEDKMFLIQICL